MIGAPILDASGRVIAPAQGAPQIPAELLAEIANGRRV